MTLVFMPTASAANLEQHCVAEATPGGDAAPAVVLALCFPAFAQAILFATGGTVVLPADFAAQDITSRLLEPAPDNHLVLGIDYEHINYGGNTLTWTGDALCSPTQSYYTNSMPGGWNDVVSSAKGFASCDTYIHYEHTFFGGATLTCTCSSMGVMNDATSSEKWFD